MASILPRAAGLAISGCGANESAEARSEGPGCVFLEGEGAKTNKRIAVMGTMTKAQAQRGEVVDFDKLILLK